jgi:hypothetical protein
MFFFEKKNQKTFDHGVRRRRVRDSQLKVFCFFSSEKKTFLALPVRLRNRSHTDVRDTEIAGGMEAGRTPAFAVLPV